MDRRAFTIIELLVVIAVTALLIALMLPAVQRVRDASRRTECASKLRQIGIALHTYHADHSVFPPGANAGGYSMHVVILPYVGYDQLYNCVNFSVIASFSYKPGPDEGNTVRGTKVELFFCPSDPGRKTVQP